MALEFPSLDNEHPQLPLLLLIRLDSCPGPDRPRQPIWKLLLQMRGFAVLAISMLHPALLAHLAAAST
eukprot:7189831-Karenia_brevis.AAC.1